MGTVLPWPGQPLVAVVVGPDECAIMLAKPGAKHSSWQTSYPRLEDAEREAREGAALCGWRFVGVFDRAKLRAAEDWRHQNRGGDAA